MDMKYTALQGVYNKQEGMRNKPSKAPRVCSAASYIVFVISAVWLLYYLTKSNEKTYPIASPNFRPLEWKEEGVLNHVSQEKKKVGHSFLLYGDMHEGGKYRIMLALCTPDSGCITGNANKYLAKKYLAKQSTGLTAIGTTLNYDDIETKVTVTNKKVGGVFTLPGALQVQMPKIPPNSKGPKLIVYTSCSNGQGVNDIGRRQTIELEKAEGGWVAKHPKEDCHILPRQLVANKGRQALVVGVTPRQSDGRPQITEINYDFFTEE